MKVLLYDICSYTQKDLIFYLEQLGFHCQNILYRYNDLYDDEFFERKFTEQLNRDDYDFVMSTNFSPIVAKICFEQNKKYLSWVYDSPIDISQISYYQYPTSFIFLFDSIDAERVAQAGGVNIFHMPLAVNPSRLSKTQITIADQKKYSCDISFIGHFYTNSFSQIMSHQTDYEKGYINAILDAQIKIYGYNFVNEIISDELLERINAPLIHLGRKEKITKEQFVHTLNKQITCTERTALLSLLGNYHDVHYYSSEQPPLLSHLSYRGEAHYYSTMPKVFRLSKLNLNPTLKCIQSGIPLRALDILASGGTLFSNYQLELAEYFTDGEDVIMYESLEDAIQKADFYLKHDDIRNQITKNGFQKVSKYFSYPEKITAMLKIAGII